VNETPPRITALILAGGQGRRMGGEDKGLLQLGGRPLFRHVIDRLQGQVDQILISANRHLAEYGRAGYPVLADTLQGYQGPLAGILTALQALDDGLLLVVPCDSPNLPLDLVQRLYQQAGVNHAAIAHDGQRLQPLFALLPRSLAAALEAYLASGQHQVSHWFEQQGARIVEFPDPEAFFNANTPEEFAKLADR